MQVGRARAHASSGGSRDRRPRREVAWSCGPCEWGAHASVGSHVSLGGAYASGGLEIAGGGSCE